MEINSCSVCSSLALTLYLLTIRYIACDGVWDVMDTEEVMWFVSLYAGQDPEIAAKELAQEAERRWRKERKPSDNVTAIVVFFNSRNSQTAEQQQQQL